MSKGAANKLQKAIYLRGIHTAMVYEFAQPFCAFVVRTANPSTTFGGPPPFDREAFPRSNCVQYIDTKKCSAKSGRAFSISIVPQGHHNRPKADFTRRQADFTWRKPYFTRRRRISLRSLSPQSPSSCRCAAGGARHRRIRCPARCPRSPGPGSCPPRRHPGP